jgi:CDP-6-deoxy-D-xylo-4-hexulose-3-dehydrase
MTKLVGDTIDKKDIAELAEWLTSGDEVPRLTKGPLTVKFEKKWAKKLGTKYSVFVNSGSSAILLMLYALKVSGRLKNDKIIVPSLSWVTDVSSVMQLGLEPILCDSNMEDLSVDLDHLEELFIKENPACLILVTVLGLVPDMSRIKELCEKYDVTLLEDTCESMGSKFQGGYLGTMGLMSCFSLYYGHHLSTIEGGLINTNDKEIYKTLLALRSHGWDRDLPEEDAKELSDKWDICADNKAYTFYYPGFNLRATDLQAFLGLRQIDKLDKFSIIRKNNFDLYNKKINNNMLNLRVDKSNFISNFAYPVVNKNRSKIMEIMTKEGIEVRPLIAGSMGRQPFWLKHYEMPELPNCDLLHEFGFYIPNHQDLTIDEINKICKIINDYGDIL